MNFECPLDVFAHYLKYPTEFTAWLKAQGYFGEPEAVKNWKRWRR